MTDWSLLLQVGSQLESKSLSRKEPVSCLIAKKKLVQIRQYLDHMANITTISGKVKANALPCFVMQTMLNLMYAHMDLYVAGSEQPAD